MLSCFGSGVNVSEKTARIAARFSNSAAANRRAASPARLNASKASMAYYANILTTLGADDVATYAKDAVFMNYLIQLLGDVSVLRHRCVAFGENDVSSSSTAASKLLQKMKS